MLTEYKGTLVGNENAFRLNEFFETRLDESHVLINTRFGGWLILSNEEYELFSQRRFDEDPVMLKKLEEVGIIITPNNIKKINFSIMRKFTKLLGYPYFYIISNTDKCNMNCIYCYPDANPKEESMSEETAKKAVDFIFQSTSKRVEMVLQGGEPLINFDLVKFIHQEALKKSKETKKFFKFGIGTNLTLMNDNIAKEISKMKISVSTSLDGPKELHDKHRFFLGGIGSYDKVVYWIKRLKEVYNVRVGMMPVITKVSLDYPPESLVDIYVSLGETTIFFKYFRPSGRASMNIKKLMMEPEEFFQYWKRGVEYCIELCKKGTFICERNTFQFVRRMLGYEDGICGDRPCGAGFSTLSFAADGTIIACNSLKSHKIFHIGHVNEDTQKTIREKTLSLSKMSAEATPLCESCPFSAYCGTCYDCTVGFHDDLYVKPPTNFECKWQKKAFRFLFQKMMDEEDKKILLSWVGARTRPCPERCAVNF